MDVKSALVFTFVFIAIFVENVESGRKRDMRMRHQRNTTMAANRSCNIDNLEQKVLDLERKITEHSDTLKSELGENNRRLQALEWDSNDAHMILEDIKNRIEMYNKDHTKKSLEIGEDSQTNSKNGMVRDADNRDLYFSENLDAKIDNLSKGLQLVVANLRLLKTEINGIRHNVTTALESAKALVPSNNYQSFKNTKVPQNCKEVQEKVSNISGIFKIQPESAPRSFMVLCEMEVNGGGWTVIHNRFDGSQDFYQNWFNYKLGFGNLGGEFWIGLEQIYHLTSSDINELLIQLEDLEGQRVQAHYTTFSVGSEAEGYSLKVLGGYRGNAGDSLSYHAGSKFSTKDIDQDQWPEGSCAQAHTGAWWYKSCDKSNLNGRYFKGDIPENFVYQGMYWEQFHGAQYSLPKARMMIRPRN